jgi:hypothetical protein
MEWEASNYFIGNSTVETDTGKTFTISKWYTQSTEINGQLLHPIIDIDPHHIFVNNCARCCSKGMHGMGIYSEAWWKVAEYYQMNGTGLSLEIAKELPDRQKKRLCTQHLAIKYKPKWRNLGLNMKQNGVNSYETGIVRLMWQESPRTKGLILIGCWQ